MAGSAWRLVRALALRVQALTTETLPVVVPFEPTTPIRPSEAIRLGRLLVPARSVRALVRLRRGEATAACAMGSMAIGYGVPARTLDGLGYWWPGGWDAAPRVKPPCVCSPTFLNWKLIGEDRLPGKRVWHKHRAWKAPVVVAHLSDEHGGRGGHSRLGDYWPTSRIADWLAGLGL